MILGWKSCGEWIQQRWVFAIMGFLCLLNTTAMKSCLSLAITEMVVETNSSEHTDETCAYSSDSKNSTTTTRNIAAGIYEWDEKLQGLILSSFFWGFIVMQLPGGMLSDKNNPEFLIREQEERNNMAAEKRTQNFKKSIM